MRVLATAGHVDHGKSTLVRALTGTDPDRWEEEKRRGLTIDLGFAWFEIDDGTEVGVVDVPGHERFITNMLAGVGTVPAVIFVVDAGEGWKPQSEEHLQILDLLEVRHAVVALTKSDTVEPDVCASRAEQIHARLEGSTLEHAPIVPVSARTGSGMEALRRALGVMLEALATPPPLPLRLFIDRVFTIEGSGTVVTGTLGEGSLEEGMSVTLMPEGHRARIRSVQSHRAARDRLDPVARAAINLAGVSPDLVRRGSVLCGQDGSRTTREFVVVLRGVRGVDGVLARAGYTVHLGTSQTPASLRLFDLRSGAPLDRLAPGERALGRIRCRDVIAALPLDRVILRDTGARRVVSGGVVVETAPGVDLDAPELAARATARSRHDIAASILATEGVVEERWLRARSGIEGSPAGAESLGPWVCSREGAEGVRARVLGAVDAAHASDPLGAGLGLDALRRQLALDDRLLDAALASLGAEIERAGTLVRRRGFARRLTPAQEERASRAIAVIEEALLRPPAPATLGLEAGMAQTLVEQGRLISIDGLLFGPRAFADARARVMAALEDGPKTTSELRGVLGTSRKFAIPLLEHLDRLGATRFDGERRWL